MKAIDKLHHVKPATKRNYHAFAVKWQAALKQALTPAQVPELLQDLVLDCQGLGFSLSAGERFAQKYQATSTTVAGLRQVISEITETELLGGALYVKCHYFQTWATTSTDFFELENLAWLQVILARIATLTAQALDFFQGKLVSLKLVSNNLRFGPVPAPGVEFEQQLTLTQNGNGTYHVLTMDRYGQEQISRTKKIRLKPAQAQGILQQFETYFHQGYETEFATDIGQWNLCLKNSEGEKFYFLGSLLATLEVEGLDLSDCLRQALKLPELNAFDGQGEPDSIQQLQASTSYDNDHVTYTEELTLTAATDQVTYQRTASDGSRMKQEFILPGQVRSLLDLLTDEQDNRLLVIEKIEEQPSYLMGDLTLTYQRRSPQHFKDFDDLPENWEKFVTRLQQALPQMFQGELFSLQGEQNGFLLDVGLMFCSVVFSENGRSYYYLSNDRTLQVGDHVLVPAGYDNHEAEAKIVEIAYYPVDDPPRPVSQTKTIIGRIE